LAILLNRTNYPLLVHCNRGKVSAFNIRHVLSC
jgi:hypothetical protein